MPEYLIEDEKTGRKWSYEGDQPPSVDEVDRIINYGQSGSTLKRMGYEAAAGIVGIGGALSKVGERVSRAVPFGLGASMAEGYRQTAEERTELQKIYGDLAQETGGNRYAGLLAGAAPNILGVATAGGLGTVAGGPVGGYRAMIGMTGLLGFGSKLTEAETAYAEKYKAANPNASDAEVREYARYYATAPAATQALAEMAITAVAPGGTEKLQGLLFKPAVATAAKTVAKTGIKGVMQKGGKVAGGAIGEIFEEESTYLVDEAIKWNTYAEDNNPFKTPSEKEISDLTNPDLSGYLNREQAIEKIKGDKFSRFISGAIDTAGVAAFYGGTISAIHNYQSDAAAAYKAQAQGNEKLAAALSEKAEANEDANIEKLLSSGQAVSFIANFGVNAEGLPVASPTFRSLEELKAFEAKSGIRHVPGSANPLLGLPAPFLDAQMLAALNILADPQTVGTKARLDADEFIKSRISQRDATEQKDLFDTINGTVAKLNEAKIDAQRAAESKASQDLPTPTPAATAAKPAAPKAEPARGEKIIGAGEFTLYRGIRGKQDASRPQYWSRRKDVAEAFSDGDVNEQKITLKNPKITNNPDDYVGMTKAQAEALRRQGYDSVVYKNGDVVVLLENPLAHEAAAAAPSPKPAPPAATGATGQQGGVVFDQEMFQGRGATPEAVYGPEAVAQGRAVPILGQGSYYAFTNSDAKAFGKVSKSRVQLRNPLVIDSSRKWAELLAAANASHLDSGGQMFYREPQGIAPATLRLKAYVQAQGHDGIVIKDTKLDQNKRLRESFGHDQVVSYASTTPPASTVATAQKMPWEMTRADYSAQVKAEYGRQGFPDLAAKQATDATHAKEVAQAIREGKIQSHPDYPDLKPTPAATVETEAEKADSEISSSFKLSRGLSNAKTRHNNGQDSYEPVFANPIDLALFIVSKKKKSKSHDKYVQELMGAGLSDEQIRVSSTEVAARVKALSLQTKAGDIINPAKLPVPPIFGRIKARSTVQAAPAALPPTLTAETGARVGETIKAAAIRTVDGTVYTGKWHPAAYEELMRAEGITREQAIEQAQKGKITDGFLTSDGRFVSREEAATIASKAKQFKPDKEGDIAFAGALKQSTLEAGPGRIEPKPATTSPAATGAAQKMPWEMVRGDRFKDANGIEFEVWKNRQGTIEAHPVVNGKPVVNKDSGVRFSVTDEAKARNPEDRTDLKPAPSAPAATPASTETPAMQNVVDAKKLENILKDVKAESVADTLLEQKAPDAIDPEREALIRAYQARKALRQEASRSRASQSVIFPTLTQPSQTTTQTPSQPAQPAQPAQPVQPVGQVQSAQPVALSDVARETLLPQPGAPKDKLRVWFAKTFDAARGLGSLAHYAIKQGAAYVTQQGDIAQRLNSQMQSAIVNDLGKSELAQGSNALNALDAVLRGTADISILPQGMAAVAKKMIAHRLETRNRLLSLPGNLLTPELRQSIIDNDDYLNRSYELFSNDKWISELDSNKKIAESLAIIVRDKIASVKLATGENITRAQAINEIKAEMTSLRGDDVSVGSGTRRSSPGVTPGVSKFILGKRKNLADAYKVILGEEKDPRVNYINTVMKVAQLTSLHQTLTSVRDIAASRGLISKAGDMVEGHTVTLSASDVGKVFEGYRTSVEYAALLKEFAGVMDNQGLFKNTIITRLSRYAKLNQTAGQLQYTAMQILGNSYSILQSGRISTFLKIPGAAQVLLRKLAGTMTEADYARYSRMLGLNVVEDTPLDLQRDILGKVVYGDSSGLSALMFKFRGSSEKVMSFFKLVDNATKMAAFEAELQILTEAYPDSSSVELDKMAVIRTADKFPSYSNIPKYIRYITEKTPFAPFLNFFYLANHNFVQSIRYGMLDLKNPKMRINGIKTLAGTAGALMAMDAIKATLQSALGDEITDDEEKVYRSGKQWYERYDDFLFYKKNGQVVGVNLSYANPLSHFRRVAKSIMASAENDDGIVEAGIMASKHLLAPLMSMDIFISSFLNAVRGSDENGKAVWLKSDESVDKIAKGIEHIASKVLIPSSIKRGFEKIIPAAEGEGKDKPYEASLKEQLVREFTSLKVERLNPKVALANQLRTFNGASSEIERNYFSKFLKEGQFYSEKDLLDKYRDMETRRRSLFQKGGKLVGTYVKSGLLEGVDPRRIARDTSVSELDMQILTGHLKYKPFVLGREARQDLFKMNLQRKEKGLRPIVVPDAALTHRFD